MLELIGPLLLPLLLLPGPAASSPSSGQLHSTFEQFVARQSFPERGPPPPPPFRANCSVPICEGPLSPIFCAGPLLSSAWFFGVQGQCPGSKLRDEPNAVMANFQSILRNGTIRRGDFLQFCDENFENTPYLRPSNLTDWTPRPAIFERIFDRKMKKFADALHQIWPSLTREFVGDVRVHQGRYPVLHVPSRFVVPGGLFKVYFYWDTFWILKGLHFSNLLETALGMLRNFAHTLKLHGFIPNSGNIQLSRRSQPPLFTQMVSDHYALTGNKSFLAEFLPHAEQELAWWRANRSTMFQFGGQEHAMYQYKALTDCPRPENLLEDFELGEQADDPRFFWSSMASACESGLDFSSRWYKWGTSGAQMQRTAIATNDVLPVDLNVFMALNYRALAKLFGEQMGDPGKAEKYQAIYEKLVTSIDRVCFDPKLGAWFDFDLAERKLRTKFYPSNVYPLMLAEGAEAKCKGVLEYLKGSGALGFSGGVPSSLEHNSNEQWDFPNGWAPQQHLFVVSLLECSHNPEAAELARSVADAFLTTAFNGLFSPTQGKPAQMWEKYDVRYGDGRSGFGGEYPPQSGFGWSNGVVLEFIRMFYTEPGELPKRNGRNLDGRLFALESLSGFLQSLDRFQ